MLSRVLILEQVMATLQVLGYKVLLKNYECNAGTIDFVAKKDGKFFFFGVMRHRIDVQLASTYYRNRYGLKDVSFEEVIL